MIIKYINFPRTRMEQLACTGFWFSELIEDTNDYGGLMSIYNHIVECEKEFDIKYPDDYDWENHMLTGDCWDMELRQFVIKYLKKI